jgi:hypothetical protein
MSDAIGVNSSLPARIGGVSMSSGLPDFYADVDSTAHLFVVDKSNGPVAPGTAATTSSLSGGQYNSAGVTLTNTQQSAFQLTSSGALIVSATLPYDTNYGTVGANTLRTASQIGNATGAANFGAGATGAQTLRVAANTYDGSGNAINSQTLSANQWLDVVIPSIGPTAPGTAASFSDLVGGQYNSTQPTLTNTQQSALQLDPLGNLRATLPDRQVTGTLAALNATITLTGLNGMSSGALEVDGSFSGTVVVEGTSGGTQYCTIALYDISLGYVTGLNFTGATVQGNYQLIGIGSYTTIKATVTAYTSGSFTATLTTSYGIDLLNVVSPYAPNFNVTAVGNVASGTADSGNGIKVSGIYNSATPTFANGQRADLQVNSSGALIVTGTVITNNPSVSQVNTTTPAYATYIGGLASTSPPTWGNGDLAPLSIENVGGYLRVADSSDGPVSPGTAAGTSLLTGGVYNSTLPTLTNTQQASLQLDASGRLIVDLGTSIPAGSATIGAVTQASGPWTMNLTQIGGSSITLGQELMAASIPVVIASNQSAIPVTQSTSPWIVQDNADGSVNGGTAGTFSQLAGGIFNSTPLTLTNGQQSSLQLNSLGYLLVAPPLLVSPATQNITVIDSASTTTTGANGQNFITGTPTAGSAATFTLSNEYSVIVQVTGTWTGTLQIEISMDGGTTWSPNPVNQDGTNYVLNAFTGNFTGRANTVGYTNFRVRAIAAMTGTAVVKITEAVGVNTVYINNPVKLTDNAGNIAVIKGANTAATTSDDALVVTISPNSPTQSYATGSGTISALNGSVVGSASGGVVFDITGTWVGTLTTQATNGDGSWINVAALSNQSGLITNSVTINGTVEMNAAGWVQVRLIATAWTSGTADVTWSSTPGSHLMIGYSSNGVNFNTYTTLTDSSQNPLGTTPASTAATAAQEALVVALSPNSPLNGVFNTTQPTVTTGQTVPIQSTARGAQIVATGVDPFNIDNITGTISLPTGAATSANQSTEITSLQLIDNPVGSVTGGTAGSGSFLIGGQFNTTLPTLTNTEQAALQLDSSARLIIAPLTNTSVVKAQLQDNSGNAILSINSQVETRDVLNVSSQYRAQSVTTTAAEALGAATILVNRKMISITPTNGTIYWGTTSAVTTTTGSPLFPNNTLFLSCTDNSPIWVIAAATTDVRIAEFS